MEARLLRRLVAAAAILLVLLTGAGVLGAQYATPNFAIHTSSPQLAERFGKVAEQLRRDLAIEWTGRAMPDWARPCPVTVQVGEHLGAGGATSFLFQRGEVYGWTMNIQGSAQRIVDSVLPHEILHMVFATHFRQPLPRWADEGAATTVEHPSEQIKHKRKLIEFLQTGRGIAFNQLFVMMDYPLPPNDPMPLYAHGYSLVDYLIQQGGRRRYVEFLDAGLKDHRWSEAVERFYGRRGLGDLQTQWVAWVAQGSPPLTAPVLPSPKQMLPTMPLERQEPPSALAANQNSAVPVNATTSTAAAPPVSPPGSWVAAARLPRPEPNLVYRDQPARQPLPDDRPLEPIRRRGDSRWPAAERIAAVDFNTAFPEDAKTVPARELAATIPPGESTPSGGPATASRAQPSSRDASGQFVLGRPQPVESPGPIILEPVGRP